MTPASEQPIPGGWSEREVFVEGFLFPLRTPANPDELLECLESPIATARPHFADPYWAKLWPAAPLLAAAVLRRKPAAGLRVLELGCGSGLVGIAALAAGLDVTFSDYVPLAVELALENAARNGFLHGRRLFLDWQADLANDDEPFAMILAADVTYDRSNLDPLLNVVERRLAPDGEAWFGDAGRSPAPDFVERARRRAWTVSRFDEFDRPVEEFVLGRFERIVLRR